MGLRSDPLLLALHGLRLKGISEAAVLAEPMGLAVAEVDVQLAAMARSGWVRHRDGRVSGWMLTPEGRVEGERLLAAEMTADGLRDRVRQVYERFLGVNVELIGVCSAWQVRNEAAAELNDHTDASYDASVLGRLTAIDAIVQPLCSELADTLDRFARYGGKLGHALARVRAGERDWFTRPLIDSYHTVWFELHEDLLATLGIERGQERDRGAA